MPGASRCANKRFPRVNAAWLAAALAATVMGSSAGHAEAGGGAGAGALTIAVTGLKSDEGQVRVAVFNAEDQWLRNPVYAEILDVKDQACEWVIEDVPYGEYGIAVFHDENGNGKNDRNIFGIPTEPYGFSNNQRRRFGPAEWDKAKFTVSSTVTGVEIRVK